MQLAKHVIAMAKTKTEDLVVSKVMATANKTLATKQKLKLRPKTNALRTLMVKIETKSVKKREEVLSQELLNRPVIEETIEVKEPRRKNKNNRNTNAAAQPQQLEPNFEEATENQTTEAVAEKPRRERKPRRNEGERDNNARKERKPRRERKATEEAPQTTETLVQEVVYETPEKIGCIGNVTFASVDMTEPQACDLPVVEASAEFAPETEFRTAGKAAGFAAITEVASVDMTEPQASDLPSTTDSTGTDNSDLVFSDAGFSSIHNLSEAAMSEPEPLAQNEAPAPKAPRQPKRKPRKEATVTPNVTAEEVAQKVTTSEAQGTPDVTSVETTLEITPATQNQTSQSAPQEAEQAELPVESMVTAFEAEDSANEASNKQ